MSILVVWSSPNTDGLTAAAKNKVIEGILAAGKEVEGKRCMLVACAGGTGNGVIACLSKLETTMRHMEILPLEMLPVIRLNRHYMLPALKEAGENFARIHDTWKQR